MRTLTLQWATGLSVGGNTDIVLLLFTINVVSSHLRSYFAKRHTCMSVTQCLGAIEVLLSMYGEKVQKHKWSKPFNF